MNHLTYCRLILAGLLMTPFLTVAQTTHPDSLWKKKLNFAFNLNQASFSTNWMGGGVSSIGLNTIFNYQANYKEGRRSWDNDIDLGFGLVNTSGQGYRKTLDRLYLDTKYGYELSKDWGVFTSLNFLTQFAKGYNYLDDGTSQLISDAFAPAFITSAWGFEYHPVDYFKVRIAPIAPRITIVSDPQRFVAAMGPEPYGVTPPETTRFEWLAFQLLAEFDKELATNVNLKWRYNMFANYETITAKTIDHRLDLDLLVKVGRFVNVSFGGILLYDYDQDSGLQLSQVFSLGFLYSFQNYVEPKE